MKIVQIITLSEPIGGAQMVLFNNTEAMAKNGHDLHIFVGNEGILTERLKGLDVKVTCLPFLKRKISIINDIKCYLSLCNLLKSYKPDIVISHSSKAGILSRFACYRTGTRNIFTIHGWSFTPGVKGTKRLLYLAIEKLMGRFTDHLIAVSKFDYDLALKHNIVPKAKVKVIYNGSPDLLIAPSDEKKPDIINILMTARFSYQKDHLTLFRALQALKNEPIHVDLLGHGQLYSQYVELSKEMGIDHLITFHGESNQMAKFLNNADIFVLTSRFEGLPLSICEAMSIGIPVLASDVGGVNEMVKNEYNGFLIPKENHEYLAEKLSKLINDSTLLKRLGENSRKTYLQNFSIEHMSISTEKYIEEVLKKS